MGEPLEQPALDTAAVGGAPGDPQLGRLACLNCRRTVDCVPADLARHMRVGDWPRCCDLVMAFYVPAGKAWEPPPAPPAGATSPASESFRIAQAQGFRPHDQRGRAITDGSGRCPHHGPGPGARGRAPYEISSRNRPGGLISVLDLIAVRVSDAAAWLGPPAAIDPPAVRAAPPALRVSATCPACGRPSAVVFPDLRAAAEVGAAPLVCLQCCGHRGRSEQAKPWVE
jgi:hypothetical protein